MLDAAQCYLGIGTVSFIPLTMYKTRLKTFINRYDIQIPNLAKYLSNLVNMLV